MHLARVALADAHAKADLLPAGIDELFKLAQHHRGGAELPPFRRGDEALGFHESVQHAHQRGALAGEILQVEQLEAGEFRRAQEGLDLPAVAVDGQLARAAEEFLVISP